MIADKTYSEILALEPWKRQQQWYKTISVEEKKEAMQIVESARRIKISMAYTPERKSKHRARMTGENNPFFGCVPTEEHRNKISEGNTGKTHLEEQNSKHSEFMSGKNNPMKRPEVAAKRSGENHHNWRGGKSFVDYGKAFNNELKNHIRERDNFTCCECHQTEEQLGCVLDVHHIDYDKKNNNPRNLIGLCKSCHMKTNYSREDWIDYFGG